VIAVVVVVAGVAWAITRSTTETADPAPVPAAPVTQQAIEPVVPTTSIAASSAGHAGPVVTMTVTATATAPPTAAAIPAPLPEPMGGPRVDITCQPGYVVQVASELSSAAFIDRVAEIRAQGMLPATTKWTETAGSCGIFATTTNAFVLYAGPFASPYDACATRLASPADAFIKGTTSQTAGDYVSCECPADSRSLPVIATPQQQGVWVGELQRILNNRLEYSIKDLNSPIAGNPTAWGTFSPDTSSAVMRFQSDESLPATGQVDAATWAALQAAQC
jgi:hypothetical protein